MVPSDDRVGPERGAIDLDGRAPRPPGSSRRPGGKRPASRPLGGPPKTSLPSEDPVHKVIFLGQGTPARRGAVRRRTGKDPPARLLLPGGLTQERWAESSRARCDG